MEKKIEQIIKVAIEGDYNGVPHQKWRWTGVRVLSADDMARVFLDPLFWKAIGKIKGWYRKEKYCNICKIKKETKTCIECGSYNYILINKEALWKNYMHIFLDKIIEKDLDHAIDWLYNLIKE